MEPHHAGAEVPGKRREAVPQPARNQEAILAAFEESAWAYHVDDPIPPRGYTPPKLRLHSAIAAGLTPVKSTT